MLFTEGENCSRASAILDTVSLPTSDSLIKQGDKNEP